MLLLVDNYDSFTYNLYHYIGELGARCVVKRNDEIGADEALSMGAEAIVLSPGPCDPDRAGICLELARKAIDRIPLLGVCLGHQAIVQALGGTIVRAPRIMHGKTDRVHHRGEGLFAGMPSPIEATRYHSLIARREDLPGELIVDAWSEDGVIQSVRHENRPVFGLQFHPESIATPDGHALLRNFLNVFAPARAA